MELKCRTAMRSEHGKLTDVLNFTDTLFLYVKECDKKENYVRKKKFGLMAQTFE